MMDAIGQIAPEQAAGTRGPLFGHPLPNILVVD